MNRRKFLAAVGALAAAPFVAHEPEGTYSTATPTTVSLADLEEAKTALDELAYRRWKGFPFDETDRELYSLVGQPAASLRIIGEKPICEVGFFKDEIAIDRLLTKYSIDFGEGFRGV